MSTAPVVKIAGTGAAAATWTTTSYTPQANSMEVAYVSAFKSTAGVALPTIHDSTDVTGANWHWLVDYEISTAANPNMRGAWFISDDVGGSPAARTVTVAATGSNSMAVSVSDVLSADTDGTIVQSASGEDLANGDPSCTFGSTPGASNICLAGASFGGGNTATARPTGFSNLANFNHSTARANSASYDVASASQGPLQYTSLNQRSIILAIELAPASSGSIASASGSITSIGTVSGVGASTAESAGSVAVNGAVAGTGASIASAAGSIAISSTVAAAGGTIASGAGAVSITSTVSGQGSSVAASSGAAAASVAATGVGSSVAAATGAIPITGTASAVGSETSAAVGTIASQATVSGVGAATKASAGSIAIAIAVNGSSAAGTISSAAGSISIGYAVSGSGSSIAASSGAIASAVSVSGAGVKISFGSGSVVASVGVSAVGRATSASVGAIPIITAVAGAASSIGSASGEIDIITTVTGIGVGASAIGGPGGRKVISVIAARLVESIEPERDVVSIDPRLVSSANSDRNTISTVSRRAVNS